MKEKKEKGFIFTIEAIYLAIIIILTLSIIYFPFEKTRGEEISIIKAQANSINSIYLNENSSVATGNNIYCRNIIKHDNGLNFENYCEEKR